MQSLKTIQNTLKSKSNVWLPKQQGKRFFRNLTLSQFPHGSIQEIDLPEQNEQQQQLQIQENKAKEKPKDTKKPLDMPKQQEQVYKYISVTRNLEEQYSQKRLLQQQDDLKAGRMKAARARWSQVPYDHNDFTHKSKETQTHNRWVSPEEIRSTFKIIDQDYILNDVREKANKFGKVNVNSNY